MLIVSAIDVLLCAFTATITLLFLGGGAASAKTTQLPGWRGVIVLTIPAESNRGVEPDVTPDSRGASGSYRFFVEPTPASPVIFSATDKTLEPIAIDVSFIGNGTSFRRHIVCAQRSTAAVFRVVGGRGPILAESGCESRESSPADVR